MVELNVTDMDALEIVARGLCAECDGTGSVMSDDWEGFREWRSRRPTVSPEAEDDLVEQYFIVVCDFSGVPPMGESCGKCGGTGRVERPIPVARLVELLVEHVERPLLPAGELDEMVDQVKRAITRAAGRSRGIEDAHDSASWLRAVEEGANALRAIGRLRPQVREDF